MTIGTLLFDSITDVLPEHRGIALSGSHGGLYPAAVASNSRLQAVIFNDAGIGLQEAGIAGVLALAEVGMAAASVCCMSARIGNAADMLARGRITRANTIATGLGVETGQPVREALACLAGAGSASSRLPAVREARSSATLPNGRKVLLLDSASLVTPDDAGQIVITGSHGGLIGGDPARAVKADVRAAVFNDAGGGAEGAGITRLPALDQRAIAAVTVDCNTARIGDAASALDTGVISHANSAAIAAGAAVGRPLSDWLTAL